MSLDEKQIIKIQKLWRGYVTRSNLKRKKDNMSLSLLQELLDRYIENDTFLDKVNKEHFSNNHKKVRRENFPEHISENLVKFAFYNKYKMMPSWNCSGDLEIELYNNQTLKLEIKAFSSTGPSSFGPTERWHYIYFVDCLKYKEKYFKIYEIKLSNENPHWNSIKINKTETYLDVCNQKKRPRISFDKLIEQLHEDHYSIIFDGYFENLVN